MKGSDRAMQKLVKLALLAALGAGVALTGAACGGSKQYEDCEVSDQYEDGDMVIRTQRYEEDCGYWEQNGTYFLRNGIVGGATWHWWSWVTLGQNSFAPAGWKPPHGLKPPYESDASKKRRKTYEKSKSSTTNKAPTGTKNGNTQPKTGPGNQSIPKGNSVPKGSSYGGSGGRVGRR